MSKLKTQQSTGSTGKSATDEYFEYETGATDVEAWYQAEVNALLQVVPVNSEEVTCILTHNNLRRFLYKANFATTVILKGVKMPRVPKTAQLAWGLAAAASAFALMGLASLVSQLRSLTIADFTKIANQSIVATVTHQEKGLDELP